MRVQTDRYNWSVPVPLDAEFARNGILIAAVLLALAAGYYSGISRPALSINPIRSFFAVIRAASQRGQGTFWLVWGMLGMATVLAFAAVVILLAVSADPS
jgi:hypothetical protein